jgi:pyruvate dehydrogenase complex dehydrogenase (E1) component
MRPAPSHRISLVIIAGPASSPAAQQGRILFDETHGVVSDSWHGRCSTDEIHRDWAERLRQKGYEVTANRISPLILAPLSQYDICALSLPTQPFAPEWVAALRAFVANGGGLLLLADAFGGGTVPNQGFGIAINPDALAHEMFYSLPSAAPAAGAEGFPIGCEAGLSCKGPLRP